MTHLIHKTRSTLSHHGHSLRYSFLVLFSLALTACAGTGADYTPIIDRPGPNYSMDLHDCQSLAQQRSYWNGDTMLSTGIGVVVGALAGATENHETAIAGAVAGGAIGAGGEALETKDERKEIVRKCMKNRGYNVVG